MFSFGTTHVHIIERLFAYALRQTAKWNAFNRNKTKSKSNGKKIIEKLW